MTTRRIPASAASSRQFRLGRGLASLTARGGSHGGSRRVLRRREWIVTGRLPPGRADRWTGGIAEQTRCRSASRSPRDRGCGHEAWHGDRRGRVSALNVTCASAYQRRVAAWRGVADHRGAAARGRRAAPEQSAAPAGLGRPGGTGRADPAAAETAATLAPPRPARTSQSMSPKSPHRPTPRSRTRRRRC